MRGVVRSSRRIKDILKIEDYNYINLLDNIRLCNFILLIRLHSVYFGVYALIRAYHYLMHRNKLSHKHEQLSCKTS